MPISNHFPDGFSVFKSKVAKGIEIVFAGLFFVERNVQTGFRRWPILKKLVVVRLNCLELVDQLGGEGIAVGISQEGGKPFDPVPSLGQRVGLLIVRHLHPMLDPSQEFVRRFEIRCA